MNNKKKEEKNINKKKKLDAIKEEEENDLAFDKSSFPSIESEVKHKTKVIGKLRTKLKQTESELKDVRAENEVTNSELLALVQALGKESKLYYSILKVLMTDNEIKKIIELSKYKEESDDWKVPPFTFKEKSMYLPNIRQHQGK